MHTRTRNNGTDFIVCLSFYTAWNLCYFKNNEINFGNDFNKFNVLFALKPVPDTKFQDNSASCKYLISPSFLTTIDMKFSIELEFVKPLMSGKSIENIMQNFEHIIVRYSSTLNLWIFGYVFANNGCVFDTFCGIFIILMIM